MTSARTAASLCVSSRAPSELEPRAGIMIEPTPQVRRGRHFFHPFVDRESLLAHSSGPQAVDENASAIRCGRRLIGALQSYHARAVRARRPCARVVRAGRVTALRHGGAANLGAMKVFGRRLGRGPSSPTSKAWLPRFDISSWCMPRRCPNARYSSRRLLSLVRPSSAMVHAHHFGASVRHGIFPIPGDDEDTSVGRDRES